MCHFCCYCGAGALAVIGLALFFSFNPLILLAIIGIILAIRLVIFLIPYIFLGIFGTIYCLFYAIFHWKK